MKKIIDKILNKLYNRKTYIIAALIAVANLVIAMGWVTVTPDQLIAINGVLGALGLGFLRAGVAKL